MSNQEGDDLKPFEGQSAPGGSAYYPRGGGPSYGSSDKLQALCDGYFGLNTVFGINVAVSLAINFASRSMGDNASVGTALGMLAGIWLGVGLLVFFLTLPHTKKIGFGKDWQPSGPFIASGLMGLNAALCCGIIGYVVMQQIAMTEMKKYGIKTGFFGIKKPNVQAVIDQMRASGN